MAFLLILVRLTPATPNLVEFFGEKRRELVIGRSWATGNHSSRNFGGFWVSSTFCSHWHRFHSHLRSFTGDFSSWKFQEPLGPNQFGSCIENFAASECGTKVIPEVFQFSESISTSHFSC